MGVWFYYEVVVYFCCNNDIFVYWCWCWEENFFWVGNIVVKEVVFIFFWVYFEVVYFGYFSNFIGVEVCGVYNDVCFDEVVVGFDVFNFVVFNFYVFNFCFKVGFDVVSYGVFN